MLEQLHAVHESIQSTTADIINQLSQTLGHKPQATSYDMLFKDPKDGCALYDDVWGA